MKKGQVPKDKKKEVLAVASTNGKKKRKNNPNFKVFKTAVRRILKVGGRTNAVQSNSYTVLNQMFEQAQMQILSQLVRLKNCNRKRKQTKQTVLKPFDIVNATLSLVDDPDERARIRRRVQDALLAFRTYDEDEERQLE